MAKFGKVKAPKMKKKNNIGKNLMFYLVIGSLLLVSFVGLQMETNKYKREIGVVSLKAEVGAKIIEASDIEAYKLPQKAIKEGMILWADREEKIINKYASMQIRAKTPIYSDMLSDEQVIRNKYLYELAPNEELLTFPYDNLKAAGRIPKPSDRFRIRGSYEIDKEDLEREQEALVLSQEQNKVKKEDVKDEDGKVIIESATGGTTLTNTVRTEIVFDVVTVVDMLNQKGDSIFEINRELNALPLAQQEELLANDTFKQGLTPHSLLLIAKTDHINKYVEFDANNKAKYTLTLLTRDKSLMEDDIRSGGSVLEGVVKPGAEGADN